MAAASKFQAISARKRLFVSVIVGLLAAAGFMALKLGRYAPLVAWDTTALVYGCWVWFTIAHMGAADTKSHAVRENPGRTVADVLLIGASIASLGAVGVLIMHASSSSGATKAFDVGLGLASVVISWATVHTGYTLNYARQYYGNVEGGIDFNENSPPRYSDFAYLAFTIGMTFQVSDTDLKTKSIRATALKHALLSYLFGTVIIATTINTLASLSK